ncbi:uncharacterized protein LOC131210696 [Anopheles bellator]|uniref:uncharacterized protein LOC131210696 n=1 Tax=Anopheles bellator TaxID=139047 RepID=UPI002648096F|nr:uncharacterized protein LOC131210696 [Anopheles bellator]
MAKLQFVFTFLLHCALQYVGDAERTPQIGYRFVPVQHGVFNFQVRASSDVHIAFDSNLDDADHVLELFIGGRNNTSSGIRSSLTGLIETPTPNVLSADEYRSFWIRWDKTAITFGRKDSDTALLSYELAHPFLIRFVSVSTGWGTDGSWVIESADGHLSPVMNTTLSTAATTPTATLPSTTTLPPTTTLPSTTTLAPTTTLPPTTKPPTTTQPPPTPQRRMPRWVKARHNNVPWNALQGGQIDSTRTLYIGRAEFKGSLLPGAVERLAGVCYVAFGGAGHYVSQYEVLTDGHGTFVPTTGDKIPANALVGGKSERGETLYIGRANFQGMTLVGKVQKSQKRLFCAHRGMELKFFKYEIFVV